MTSNSSFVRREEIIIHVLTRITRLIIQFFKLILRYSGGCRGGGVTGVPTSPLLVYLFKKNVILGSQDPYKVTPFSSFMKVNV